ncbi:DNA-directed RNA polymerase V subunit 7-like isoform X2 [Mangifera indica]|uniref:DNA-directed RNA polymerase V subunit 7-like isoform X2 n=1 Tax=Mangifera indica TaxID=29780 RepID=UPI001CFAA238|nr:DNA-directed RNA polymerase V subunit 7-like isoform X2 [Mangifera indica]
MKIAEMIYEVELHRTLIARPVRSSDGKLLVSGRYLLTQVLEILSQEKASNEHGVFLAVNSLKNIDKGQVLDESGCTSFTVTVQCRSFKPEVGDVLQGFVHYIFQEGVFLQTGPVRYGFLPFMKMPGYLYFPAAEQDPFFLQGETNKKIKMGSVVQFVVLGVSWIEETAHVVREFALVAGIDREGLGPVYLPGTAEINQ